jgi:hypothetical protein
MEISLYSVRGEWDCSRKAILEVKESLDAWDISTAPHGVDFRHPVALVQLGNAGELKPSLPTEHGFPDLLVGRVEGQLVPG